MKCKLLAATLIANPLWSQAALDKARSMRVPYTVPPEIEVSAGYVLTDPNAWVHCCPGDLNAPAIAEPADDECVAAVREWMEVKRPAAIAAIAAQLEQIDMITNAEDKKRLMAMGKAYGLLPSKEKKLADAGK